MIENMDPEALSAYRRLMASCSDLDAARRRAAQADLRDRPGTRVVTAEQLARLARSSAASHDLVENAGRVALGEYVWERIEVDAVPIPPEVAELKADSTVEWPAQWPLPRRRAEAPEEPYRIPWQ